VTDGDVRSFVQALAVAFAVGMCRRRPVRRWDWYGAGPAPRGVGAPIMLTEFALTAVFFGGARWGRPPTVADERASVPAGRGRGVRPARGPFVSLHLLLGGSRAGRAVVAAETPCKLILSLIGLLVVAAPWPAGLVMRFLERASTSRASMLARRRPPPGAGARRSTPVNRAAARSADPPGP
jgi:hypothetical protein